LIQRTQAQGLQHAALLLGVRTYMPPDEGILLLQLGKTPGGVHTLTSYQSGPDPVPLRPEAPYQRLASYPSASSSLSSSLLSVGLSLQMPSPPQASDYPSPGASSSGSWMATPSALTCA